MPGVTALNSPVAGRLNTRGCIALIMAIGNRRAINRRHDANVAHIGMATASAPLAASAIEAIALNIARRRR